MKWLVRIVAVPPLIALSAAGVIMSVILLPVTLPLAIGSLFELENAEAYLDSQGVDPDDCGRFFYYLFTAMGVIVPVIPLILVGEAWRCVLAPRQS